MEVRPLLPEERQTLFTAKQPVVRSIPLAKVEVAPVMLRALACTPPAKVEVEVTEPRTVVVAVPSPTVRYVEADRAEEEALVMERRVGRERVTAPVAPETEIWLAVPAREVTPVLVTAPFEYVRPVEKVVVACQVGTPETRASTCPLVPEEVVETAPVPLPRRMEFDCRAAQPVPPEVVGKIPETSAVREMEELDTRPAVALRKPERPPTVRLPVERLVEEAVVAKKLVVVALLPVAFTKVKFWRVEELVAWSEGTVRVVPSKVKDTEEARLSAVVV
jgi:hypothetical protein